MNKSNSILANNVEESVACKNIDRAKDKNQIGGRMQGTFNKVSDHFVKLYIGIAWV